MNGLGNTAKQPIPHDLITLREALQLLGNAMERGRLALDQMGEARDSAPQARLAQALSEMEALLPRLSTSAQQLAQDYGTRQGQNGELAALFHVTQLINSPLGLNQMLKQVMDQIIQLTQAERGFLMLVHNGELEFQVARNMDRQTIEGPSFQISRTIVRHVVTQGKPIVTTNAQTDPRFRTQESVVNYHLRSILCVPLRVKEKITGVIYADNRVKSGLFSDHDLDTLSAFANQAAVAIENARLFEQIAQALTRERRLNEVTHAISSALDLPSLLQSIIRLTVELVNADMGTIVLLSPNSDIYADFMCYFPPEMAETSLVKDWGLVRQIFESGQSLLLPDYTTYPKARLNWIMSGVRSFMGIPLCHGETPVGALGLFSTDTGKSFDARDLALAESVGRQASVAIENARLFEAELRQLDELSILHAVATACAEATQEDILIERVTQIIGNTFYPDSFGVLLLDESQNVLRMHPSYRTRHIIPRDNIPMGQGITGTVAQNGQPWRVTDVRQEPKYIQDDEQIHSELCVPLKVDERVIGVINAESAQLEAFSKADERMLITVAGQLATAIAKLQLFERERRRYKEAETLRKATAALTSALDLDQVLDDILIHLKQVIPYDSAAVFLLKKESMQIVAAQGFQTLEQMIGQDLPSSNALFDEIQRTQRPLCLTDACADSRFEGWGNADYVRGWIGVPLVVRGQVIGYMTIDSRREAAYGTAEAALARAFANQAAVAIENARLFADTQRRAEELAKTLARQEELDRLKDEFLQNTSHELRTPLSIIRGYADLLHNEELGSLQPKQKEAIGIMRRRARMLTKLLNDFTAIVTAQTMMPKKERIDLSQLVQALLIDFQASAQSAGLTLEVEIAPQIPSVSGNPTHLERVLDNLVDNALKFTPEGGRITVRLWSEPDVVIFEVSDTGVGIPADQLGRIFERFYQVDGSTRRRYSGTGLGLALVKEIVEAHDGRVSVRSILNQGSTFRVTLPSMKRA